MERCYSIINLSAACMGKYASDDITSASYNSVPMECQQFLLGLTKLHSKELHCVVPELSFTQSVIAICCSIQLRKYACNVSQIWLLFACSSREYITIHILLYYNVTFGSLSSRITQQSNSYRNIGFKITKYLIAWGYHLFQGSMCLYSWFEWPYFTNHPRCLVGITECWLEAAYCMEEF